MTETIAFKDLPNSDLILGAVYLGGNQKHAGDDPIAKLLPVGNQGGFRYKGSPVKNTVRFAVVYTSGEEVEWPDHLEEKSGVLTYFGDNRRPGRELHDTRRKGNVLLRNVFSATYGTAAERESLPPFVLFEKVPPGRTVRFKGLLAPGMADSTAENDLARVWKQSAGSQFENYQAKFTVLSTKRLTRDWINAVVEGVPATLAPDCPQSWTQWVNYRSYDAFVPYAPRLG